MNQTKKRLSIINHAISITDIETIQLQVLKLALLKSDLKIQEIVTAIQAENYAQAQRLINQYIETPSDNVLQRTSQKAEAAMTEEEQAIIDEFDLFITPTTGKSSEEVDINDLLVDELPVHTEGKQQKADDSDYDALLNIDSQDVLADNIEIDVTDTSKDTFFDTPKEKHRQTVDTSSVSQDTFFATPGNTEEETLAQESDTSTQQEVRSQEEELREVKPTGITEEKVRAFTYKAIPYIAQKLITMKKEYPPVERSYEKFDSVENLLRKISQEGYSENEIEETLTYISQLSEENEKTQAAQLLLVCAATESKFGQFMLARELFKGTLLTKDIPEAFAQMHRLALEEYPEALCDIGQFYEHGIGTDKDIEKAEQYFKEAMEFGIKRAKKHYQRLHKQSRRFFKK